MTNGKSRPTGVAVVAWSWILTGGFMVILGIVALLVSSMMPEIPDLSEIPARNVPGTGLMVGLSENFSGLVWAQLVFGVLALVAGVEFLKLKSWARTILEVLSWLSLIYVIGFGVLWVAMWSFMLGQFSLMQMPFDVERFQAIGLVSGLVVSLVFAIPLVWFIKVLRGRVVREAIQQSGSSVRNIG